ncbi:hypothetical protein GPECTOR_21g642 [Gonium pectorale]|uniref:Uncharacterized protein n=1 Tax=Gonium pectorale TaxID=33097 RepID=A0A150GHV2_GONPE|nr:hypothetical protein GPECTOR_21g642 [Gonium pectorale]|eukprot:KXZ49416.1 hypothetical protein GPECTOR_21g642 [Gonium pectorale]
MDPVLALQRWLVFVACLRMLAGTTLFSFGVALVFFLSELLVYKTLSIRGAIMPMIIATTSTVWLAVGWEFYTNTKP